MVGTMHTNNMEFAGNDGESHDTSIKKRQNSEKARQQGTHPDTNDDSGKPMGYIGDSDHSMKKRQNSEKARQRGTHPDMNDGPSD